jgi:DNA-binding transcriptional regulator YhcF (GntR family)
MTKNWINDFSTTPKYRQIVNSIISEIESGHMKEGDQLPSVNKLLIKYSISRDTAVKAYEMLKNQSIVDSVPGKGFYIKNTSFRPKARVFLLFNKLSAHKQLIYDAFTQTLGDDVPIDFFIYNNDFHLFKKILLSHINGNYTHFAIIAHFIEGGEDALEFIKEHLPINKIVILDKKLVGLPDGYASVYQDFEQDLYSALHEALPLLAKYRKLKLIFPPYNYHPKEIIAGFNKFCDEYAFEHMVVADIAEEPISKGEVYINLVENDLVTLIKRVRNLNLAIGSEVGILSYNETPLKEILLDGITIISTDFAKLGKTAAEMILSNKKKHVANPFRLVVRNSL